MSDSLRPHELQHSKPPCQSPTPVVHWVGDAIQPSHPLSSPSQTAFNLSQHQGFFKWVSFSHQVAKILVSALTSVLPMNTQDWFPLGWTGWISSQSKGLSRVFSNTTVQKYQFFWAHFLYTPTLTSIPDYWKNRSLDYMDLCQQSDASAMVASTASPEAGALSCCRSCMHVSAHPLFIGWLPRASEIQAVLRNFVF